MVVVVIIFVRVLTDYYVYIHMMEYAYIGTCMVLELNDLVQFFTEKCKGTKENRVCGQEFATWHDAFGS